MEPFEGITNDMGATIRKNSEEGNLPELMRKFKIQLAAGVFT